MTEQVVARLVEAYAPLPEVVAIGLGGSLVARPDPLSDVDLYVFVNAVIGDAERLAVIGRFDPPALDLTRVLAGPGGDEFHDGPSGREIDVMYWDPGWLADRVAAVTVRHEAAAEYSTALWFTARSMRILHDPSGALGALQAAAAVPYPDELRHRIVRGNTDVLRRTQSSYLHQVEKAIARHDEVSVNHRVAALLGAYFDVILAANRALHPGEKRLLEHVESHRLRCPEGMRRDVEAVVAAAVPDSETLVEAINRLAAGLEAFADAELVPDGTTTRP
ncbi:MAG: hypothetical protein WCK58_02795 [Chloroflexota bacterium]